MLRKEEGKGSARGYCEQNGAFVAGFKPERLARNNAPSVLGSGALAVSLETRLTGTVGGIRTAVSEVKFLDYRVTDDCEGIYQGCFH